MIFGINTESITAVANVVMAIGAALIFWQIRQAKIQARTDFEDALSEEYRRIIHSLPSKALLGEKLSKRELTASLDEFLTYIDLCNEQAFLRQKKRVRSDTWRFWADGMRSNLSRPAFNSAWEFIKEKSVSDFQELRRLEASRFKDDPAKW